jgi:hypothetical protein
MKARRKRKDQIERKKPGQNDTSYQTWQHIEQRNQDSHAKKIKQCATADTRKITNIAGHLSNKQQQSKQVIHPCMQPAILDVGDN